jgi:branched-chain amino acid transport system permease protein
MTSRTLAVYPALAGLGVLLFLGLQFSNSFYSGILASILIWSVAVSGLNIVAGLGGYPSLMQGGFYGLGAYASSLVLAAGQGIAVAVLAAIALSIAAGLVVGIVFSRTRGQYFAIGTLFFGVVVTLGLTNWTALTGGPLGLSVTFAFASQPELNGVIAASAAGAMMLVRAIGASRLGRQLTTVREDEDYAEHLGVPTARVKLLGFLISAGFGGYAGFLIAQYNGAISPDLFDYTVGFVMFVAFSIGGAGRLPGPLLGSAIIVGVPDMLNLPSGAGLLLVGLVFVVVVIVAPDGLLGLAASLAARLRRTPQAERP